MDEVQDWKGLSILDKIEHKNWKARVEGYEGAFKEMKSSNNPKDPIFNSYLGLIKSMVNDNNAVAQEMALAVVLIFLQEANIAFKVVNDICPGIVSKCLCSNRLKTKEYGFEILKTIIEFEKHDVVMNELLKGLNSKTPKIVVGSLLFLKECLHEFGTAPKIIRIKELFKVVPKLLEDRDKGVRETGKELIIEIYYWLGEPALKSVLSQLKPVQLTELTIKFEKLPAEKPSATRYLHSQKPKEESVSKSTGDGDGISSQKRSADQISKTDIDSYEFLEPIEVISKIPSNFYEKLDEKKWTDRKEALEIVEGLTNHEKLVPGEYGELLKALLYVVAKDANIVLVALAAKIIYQIAHGLRQKYSSYATNTIQVCLEKFKEKRANVVKVLRDAVDSAFAATTLEACIEDIEKALDHKTPSVKSEASLFLSRYFEKPSTKPPTKKALNQLMTVLTKQCLDSTPEVREASFQTLGTMMNVIPEKTIKPYLESIDRVKMARINEFYEKVKTAQSKNPVIVHSSYRNRLKRSINTVFNGHPVSMQDLENNNCRFQLDDEPVEHVKRKISNFRGINKIRANDSPISPMINGDIGDEQATRITPNTENSNSISTAGLKSKNENHNSDSSSPLIKMRDDGQLFEDVLKLSLFTRFAKMSKVPDKYMIDNYKWLQQFNRKFERFQREMLHLSDNPLKQMIDNIRSENLTTSAFAGQSVREWISSKDGSINIIEQVAPLLMVVNCQQIRRVSLMLSNTATNPDFGTITTVTKNACWLLKQVVITGGDHSLIKQIDSDVILATLLVLLELHRANWNSSWLSVWSESVQIQKWIRGLTNEIKQRTIPLPISDIAMIVTSLVMESKVTTVVDSSLLDQIDLPGLLDMLYYRHR